MSLLAVIQPQEKEAGRKSKIYSADFESQKDDLLKQYQSGDITKVL
jgi:hypothetical protein